MHLASFVYFRAITIIFVVAGHAFGVFGLEMDALWKVAIKNLLTGGTSLFLFISGFMFHHVFYKKYDFKPFVLSKLRNVLIPYLVLGLVPVGFYVATKNSGYGEFFLPAADGFAHEYLIPAIKYFSTGRFLTAYWYIPFIMITFLMAPLHVKFIQSSSAMQITVMALLSFLSLFIHRPIDNISVIHSLVYFTPIYLFGIWCSINRERILQSMQGKELHLILLAVFLAVWQAYLGSDGNYHKPALEYAGLDLMYLQKMVLCVFFMVWLHRFEGAKIAPVISVLSSTSFAIFFIHPFINEILRKLDLGLNELDSWVAYALFVVVVLSLCAWISTTIKRLFPAHSRYLIGY